MMSIILGGLITLGLVTIASVECDTLNLVNKIFEKEE